MNKIRTDAELAEAVCFPHENFTPGEVARLFRVDPKTVSRWAASGKLVGWQTPGGHYRFKATVVRKALDGDEVEVDEEEEM